MTKYLNPQIRGMSKNTKSAYGQLYYLKHREKRRRYQKEYYLKHRDELRKKENEKRKSPESKEKAREYARVYYAKNRERLIEKRKQLHRKKQEAHDAHREAKRKRIIARAALKVAGPITDEFCGTDLPPETPEEFR